MGLDVVGRRKSKVTIFTTVPCKKKFLGKNIPWKKHSSEKTFHGSKIHWKKIPWNDIPWNKFPCSVVQPQALPLGARTGPKKFFHHNSDPWTISFRSSHKSPNSSTPWKLEAVTDGRTDKVRTIALFSKGKFAKNITYLFSHTYHEEPVNK